MLNSIILIIIILLVFFYFVKSSNNYVSNELFKSINDDKVTILMFLSSHCHHCNTYKQNMHKIIQEFAQSKGYNYEVVPENDSRFSEFDIKYVPACFILKNNKKKQLAGEININNIEDTIKNI
jgi:thioredoxin-related protein